MASATPSAATSRTRPTPPRSTACSPLLGLEPWDITRFGEGVAAELGLRERPHDRAAWIDVLVANPVLIERPIFVTDDGRVAIGRPPEAVEALL